MKRAFLILVVLVVLVGWGRAQTSDSLRAVQRSYLDQIEVLNKQVNSLESSILPGDTLVFTLNTDQLWGPKPAYKMKLTAQQKKDFLNLIKTIKDQISVYQAKLKASVK